MKKLLTLIAIFLLPLATFAQVNQSAGPQYVSNMNFPDHCYYYDSCPISLQNILIKGVGIIWLVSIIYLVYCFVNFLLKKTIVKKRFKIALSLFSLGAIYIIFRIIQIYL